MRPEVCLTAQLSNVPPWTHWIGCLCGFGWRLVFTQKHKYHVRRIIIITAKLPRTILVIRSGYGPQRHGPVAQFRCCWSVLAYSMSCDKANTTGASNNHLNFFLQIFETRRYGGSITLVRASSITTSYVSYDVRCLLDAIMISCRYDK